MQKKNRYRNRVRFMTVFRILFLGLFAAVAGVTFVALRNEHVTRGHEIVAAEKRIADLRQESEMWELRIAGVHDRIDLRRRLRWMKSDLQEIEPGRVMRIVPEEGYSSPVVGVF